MEILNKPGFGITRKFFYILWEFGPLATAIHVNNFFRSHLDRVPGCRRFFLSTDRLICAVQLYLDRSFDRKYGVDTSGIIPLKDLTIESENIERGIWYQAMSVKIFKQIMNHLAISFGEYTFIDFGSGKGRVLLLSSEYGFKKIIGVEFSQELHHIATQNIAIYNRRTQKASNVESICTDAVKFSFPDSPMVIFLFSPFEGKVMEQFLNNLSTSISTNPRDFVIIFSGSSPETIKILESTTFRWEELKTRSDWSQFMKYECLLSTRQD